MRTVFILTTMLLFSLLNCGAYDTKPSKAKEAYISNNILELVKLSTSSGEEARQANEYLSMMNYSDFSYDELNKILNRLPSSSPVYNLVKDLLTQKEIAQLNHLNEMTGEEFYAFRIQHPEYSSLTDEYISALQQGLDKLNYGELKYLQQQVPVFDRNTLKGLSTKRKSEVEADVKKYLDAYCEWERKAMKIFATSLKYEIMKGLRMQFSSFAQAYSMDDDLETDNAYAIYNKFMNLMYSHWNANIISDYLRAQASQYCAIINAKRSEVLGSLDIDGSLPMRLTLPNSDVNITLGIGGFEKMAALRDDLNGSKTGSSIVAGLFGLVTGWNFIADTGEAIYNSSKNGEEARAELPHRRNYLLAAYDKMHNKTSAFAKQMASGFETQQNSQTKEFYNYVLKNY